MCIWWYILQNYNYKLHFQNLCIYHHIPHVSIRNFQNLSIYHIPHVSMGTLATENLDVCTACDREIATYSWPWEKTGDSFCRSTWIYILRFSFPRRRRRLLQQQEDGGVIEYLQLDWMDDGTDGWKKLHDNDVLYYM